MTTTPALTFRPARRDEAAAVADLVNSGYRGDSSRQGWTTEAHLLDGRRTEECEVRDIIDAEDSVILLCQRDGDVIGSVLLRKTEPAVAYLGMLVVKPTLQGGGIGKELMAAAETLVRERWGATKMWMTVITIREELLAYYVRRGYRRTGRTRPFAAAHDLTQPLVEGLEVEVLEKPL